MPGYYDEDQEEFFDPDDIDGDWVRQTFADPGGHSALRAAGPGNPRDQTCPSCGRQGMLTRQDVALGYQCDICADKAERGLGPED